MRQKSVRFCPICKSKKSKIIFKQKFNDQLVHNIASCRKCEFVFVSNTQNQRYYNSYYTYMNKYEDERDYQLHKKYCIFIKRFCAETERILDIGCSTGHLLFLLKKAGYLDIGGIDPAPNCKSIAFDQFGINIQTIDLFSFKAKKKYDFIMLTMVLEHVEKVRETVDKIGSILSEGGKLFISVPDGENFHVDFDEPFGEFSTEHINFFSRHHLGLLMSDFECQSIKSDNKVIFSLWKKKPSLKKSMFKYIKKSSSKLKTLNDIINKAPGKLLVWGAGSLTRRLFQTTSLRVRTLKLIDRDKNLIGKKIDGIEIISPKEIYNYTDPILISSYRFKEEIIKYIKINNLKNTIYTL